MTLTSEQKAANKEAQKRRNRAYRTRRNEVQAFEDQGEAIVESEFAPATRVAEEAEESLRANLTAEIMEIERQILALKARQDEIRFEYAPKLEEARRATSAAFDMVRKAKAAVRLSSEERFPDMLGNSRWSAAAWGATEHAKTILAKAI